MIIQNVDRICRTPIYPNIISVTFMAQKSYKHNIFSGTFWLSFFLIASIFPHCFIKGDDGDLW